jgi:hypothetical protein
MPAMQLAIKQKMLHQRLNESTIALMIASKYNQAYF